MAMALGTSAHPLYLYIVFVACVVGAVALLISGWISHRRSAWPRYWQTQSTHRVDVDAAAKTEPAYPGEPGAPTTIAIPDATSSVPAKKTTPRKSTTGTTRTAAKKTTAKKTTPRKTS